MQDLISAIASIFVLIVSEFIRFTLDYPTYAIPLFAFGGLVIYWRETGRFPVIGWLVRWLYLPINLLACVLWLMLTPLKGLIGLLDYVPVFKLALLLFSVLLCWQNPLFIGFTLLLLLAFTVGINTQRIQARINYYPTAKRTPAPKVKQAKALPAIKPLKPAAPTLQPPPLVAIAVTRQGSAYSEQQLISALPPHLQTLMVSKRIEQPAAPSKSYTQKPIKLVLRSLLLLPLWLLLLPVRGIRLALQHLNKKPTPEPSEPITQEAGSNE